MITLSKDADNITSALNFINNSDCLREIIRLYLRSYDTFYDFLEFYISTDDVSLEANAVIMRYNNTVYVLLSSEITDELRIFVSGFYGCELFCNLPIIKNAESQSYAVMSKRGEPLCTDNAVSVVDNPRLISDVITADMTDDASMDFYLNTAHMLRHNAISVSAYYIDDNPVSIVGASSVSNNISYLCFVSTDKHFRGNGYSAKTLGFVCSSPCVTYMLLCEKQYIRFYEKSGFSQTDICVKYNL